VQLAGEADRRPVAVLGDMLELGPDAAAYHREVGAYAAKVGVESLWATGAYAQAMVDAFSEGTSTVRAAFVFTMDEMGSGRPVGGEAPALARVADVLHELGPHDAVLVKASRGVCLERVVSALRAQRADIAGRAED
jgi:UDP-N-acetylmuramoyl-tripeptide--D-alanyl-D-alanine ligase